MAKSDLLKQEKFLFIAKICLWAAYITLGAGMIYTRLLKDTSLIRDHFNDTKNCTSDAWMYPASDKKSNITACPAVINAAVRRSMQYEKYIHQAQKSGKWVPLNIVTESLEACETGLQVREDDLSFGHNKLSIQWECGQVEMCCVGGCCEQTTVEFTGEANKGNMATTVKYTSIIIMSIAIMLVAVALEYLPEGVEAEDENRDSEGEEETESEESSTDSPDTSDEESDDDSSSDSEDSDSDDSDEDEEETESESSEEVSDEDSFAENSNSEDLSDTLEKSSDEDEEESAASSSSDVVPLHILIDDMEEKDKQTKLNTIIDHYFALNNDRLDRILSRVNSL